MVYYNRANAKAELKNYKGALKDYTQAINSYQGEPENSSLYFNRANTYVDLRKFKEAVTDYDKVIAIGPRYDHALYNKGNTLVVMGCFEDALYCYKQLEKKGGYNVFVADNRRELERIIDNIGDLEVRVSLEGKRAVREQQMYVESEILSIEFYAYQWTKSEISLSWQRGKYWELRREQASWGKGYLQKPGFKAKINRVVM